MAGFTTARALVRLTRAWRAWLLIALVALLSSAAGIARMPVPGMSMSDSELVELEVGASAPVRAHIAALAGP